MAAPSEPRHTVLLVDDAEGCVETLDLALQMMPGVLIRSARTAERALEVLESHPVSVLVTDVHLPAMDGLEMILILRRQPRFEALPIVVISADTDPAAARNALESGANAFFAKPFSPSAVRKKLEELIHE
jgi:putative two-component system response regulator